jgi:hypothetical protein
MNMLCPLRDTNRTCKLQEFMLKPQVKKVPDIFSNIAPKTEKGGRGLRFPACRFPSIFDMARTVFEVLHLEAHKAHKSLRLRFLQLFYDKLALTCSSYPSLERHDRKESWKSR